ncbi:hypothetical protein QCA50_019881 [Cerrena zonata]|uniref:ATPase inhibitor, mitochondrial n=1 Tax=Cerrena zonata TaxID=2478898 RepID=A0AAW0FJ04_9APHY
MLARITINSARRLPRVAPTVQRFYSEDSFHKKEKAHEDQYARAHEKEQLAKIRKQIEEKKAELAKLEAAAAEHIEGKKQ